MNVKKDMSEEELISEVKKIKKINKHLKDKIIIKIFIPQKLINIVVK